MINRPSATPIDKFKRFKKLIWCLPLGILISFWKLEVQEAIMFTGILVVITIVDYRRFKKGADQYMCEHSSTNV